MKFLSAGEVAKELGIEYFRVIRMIKRNEFPGSFKVGWGWSIPASTVRKRSKVTWKKNIKALNPDHDMKTLQFTGNEKFNNNLWLAAVVAVKMLK